MDTNSTENLNTSNQNLKVNTSQNAEPGLKSQKSINPQAVWMDEYYLPTQDLLEMQRTISNSNYSLNRAMSIRDQDVVHRERSLLFEQALNKTPLQAQILANKSIIEEDEDLEQIMDLPDEHADVEEYMRKRLQIISETKKDHFSAGIKLQKIEIQAEKKLMKLRDELYAEDPSIVTGFYYDKHKKLQASKLFDALKAMPKPAVHHCHLTAAAPLDYLIRLTYYDFVYYSERENIFKVSKKGIDKEGYQKITTLRKYWSNSLDFDNYLREKILLGRGQCDCQESHPIWQAFQPKFMLTCDLYNYAEFFEKILYKVCKVFIKEMVFVLELRQIFGMVIDDDGKPVGIQEEIRIFQRVLAKVQRDYPLFNIRLIICGLKILGEPHCLKMLQGTSEGNALSELVVAFDMVNEEDQTPPIVDFVHMIQDYRAHRHQDLQVVLHAGESVERGNDNLVDAVLLGTKRIGHGFALAKHPQLQEIVKKQGICIECCPISNMVLGYTLDLRTHPVRAFLHQGLPVSISPDDPGFFDAEGVTLDYVYAFLAWELDLADLKQLCYNSLNYSLISEEEKDQLRPFFETRWIRFLEYIRGKY